MKITHVRVKYIYESPGVGEKPEHVGEHITGFFTSLEAANYELPDDEYVFNINDIEFCPRCGLAQ